MEAYDSRTDEYIARAQPFARPILQHLRELVHKACPEVTETIKWGAPFFEYKGFMCMMAGFKNHASFGFWKGKLMSDPNGIMDKGEGDKTAMGHFRALKTLEDLPANKILIAYIKEAMRLNEEDIKVAPKPKTAPMAEQPVPDELATLLAANPTSRKQWEAFAPSHRREYIKWINEARTAPTKQKRLATTIEWLLEGKQRMWKYQK
jgi:uncharacterized protein YdeI (YjbR/CyaY-like superfamily)